MSRLSSFLCLVAAASAAAPGLAAVSAATASTVLYAGSVLEPRGSVTNITSDFGAHQAVFAGGEARASVTLGADSASVPFISFSASASGQAYADLTGQVFYSWVVQGNAADNELIPVTITTMGWIKGQVTKQALKADVPVDAWLSMMGMSIKTDFQTSVEGGLDFRGYGLETGNRNAGGTDVFLDSYAQSQPGGSVTVQDAASFSETFSLSVRANVVNSVHMWVQGGTGYGVVVTDADSARYSWSMSGYIDPIITIDPAYASRFSLVQSNIPMVPVPEASTWAMLLAGLGLLVLAARRRN